MNTEKSKAVTYQTKLKGEFSIVGRSEVTLLVEAIRNDCIHKGIPIHIDREGFFKLTFSLTIGPTSQSNISKIVGVLKDCISHANFITELRSILS